MGKVKDKFYEEVATGIDYELTEDLLNFFTAWQTSEGGRAKFNPFNTTLPEGNSKNYNKIGVQSYETHADGVTATISTLKESRYASLLKSIRSGAGPYYLAVELDRSPWGTKGWLVCQVLHDNDVRN